MKGYAKKVLQVLQIHSLPVATSGKVTEIFVTPWVLHGVTKSVTNPRSLRNPIVLRPFAILFPCLPASLCLPSAEKCYRFGRVTLFDLEKVLQTEGFNCCHLLGRYRFQGRIRYFLLCY